MKGAFTTGQIAKMFKASQQTVIRWIEKGGLTGFRTPNPNDRGARWVTLATLNTFAKERGMPIGRYEHDGKPKILFVGCEKIRSAMSNSLQGAKLEFENGTWGAGMALQSSCFDVVVIDVTTTDHADVIYKGMRKLLEFSQMTVIYLHDVNKKPTFVPARQSKHLWQKPFDPVLLARNIERESLSTQTV